MKSFLTLTLTIFSFAVSAEPLLLTGSLKSERAHAMLVPLTTNMNSKISWMAEEGARISAGDLVVQFDGSEVESLRLQEEEQLQKTRAQAKRDVATLETELIQAQLETERTRVDFEKAKVDAAVPSELIGNIDYEEYQLTRERAENAYTEARQTTQDKREQLAEKRIEVTLDIKRGYQRLKRWEAMLGSFELRSEIDGHFIHKLHPWMGTKFQSGDNVRTSWTIGEVADATNMIIQAWVHEVDLPKVQVGDQAIVSFDALRGISTAGQVLTIASSGINRPQWGEALYYEVSVGFKKPTEKVTPGMSVLIHIDRPDS